MSPLECQRTATIVQSNHIPWKGKEAGITVDSIDFAGYPEYPQLHPPFEHGFSAHDLLFNVRPASDCYLKLAARPTRVAP